MAARSDARKSREDALRIAEHQRVREAMQRALAEVYSGAGFIDADALLDHLSDLGARVEVA